MSGAGGITTLIFCDGEVASVGVFGELDLYTGGELNTILVECLDQRPARLVVDVSAVSFCDLTGATALADVRDSAVRAGTEFLLSGVRTPTLMRILTLSGLDAVYGLRQQDRRPFALPGSAPRKTEGDTRRGIPACRHRSVTRAAVNLWRKMGSWCGCSPARPGRVVWRTWDCSQ